jgi:hypothetical protein
MTYAAIHEVALAPFRAMRYINERRSRSDHRQKRRIPMPNRAIETHSGVIRFEPYTQTSPLLDVALRIYAAVWPDRDPAVARESFTRYAGYDGFCGFVAYHGHEAVGVGYGANSVPGIWWHDRVTPVLGSDHPALQDAWRLVELAVVATHRQIGIGGYLHDTLLAAQPCPRVLLCTGVANTRARTMYERRGWYYIAPAFDFPGEPHPYTIMGKELRTSASCFARSSEDAAEEGEDEVFPLVAENIT